MKLLIDENVPRSVSDSFRSRGHEVLFVRDLLPAGSPDPLIAAIGDELGTIVVTWDRDFHKLVSRAPSGTHARLRNLGRISFRCNEAHGRARLEAVIDLIEFEYEHAQERRDSRLIIDVLESAIRINR